MFDRQRHETAVVGKYNALVLQHVDNFMRAPLQPFLSASRFVLGSLPLAFLSQPKLVLLASLLVAPSLSCLGFLCFQLKVRQPPSRSTSENGVTDDIRRRIVGEVR